ncbi:hypothetical protein GGI21_004844 [Coemansia aciculifera]|nr:hypothetical protein GGI21_004844 [Coemansia aciculifera]
MGNVKKILVWCARHTACIPQRGRSRLLASRRRRSSTLDSAESGSGDGRNPSMETLVDEKYRERAFSDAQPLPTDVPEPHQNEYSYYPWSESEYCEMLSRSPPPPRRPHYETFPSLVEMGGFLSL